MAIDVNFIHDLLQKADIQSVISSYVSLSRSGKNLKGLCPFHNEKTASFVVYPENNSFYCFGCGAGGDAITFIKRIENLDYVEAVKFLAQAYNMPMPEEGYDDSFIKLKRRIYNANREAAKFFNAQLFEPANKAGLEYLTGKRKLPISIIRHFGLGFAPDSWDSLVKHMKSQGYSDQELILANLARRSEKSGKIYDNFRNRIIYPIIDLQGNVIAFGGRVMDDSKPKYINTSDTPVFKKGNGVFALNFAKNSSEKRLILVEGYMDVISLHNAGFTNAIACLGTAFTSEMANLLSRYADEVFICYDNDEAGQKATKRALEILGNTGLKLKVINMEGGKDADEILRTYGAERFRDIINGASNRIEYQINEELQKHNVMSDDGKVRFLTAAANILASCSAIEREIYVNRLSNEFGISKESFNAQIVSAQKKLKKQMNAEKIKNDEIALRSSFTDKNNPDRENHLKAANAEEILIASLARNNDFYKKIGDKFSPDDFVTEFNKRIIKKLTELLKEGCSTDISMFSSDFSNEEMGSVARILLHSEKLANTIKECEDCIQVLKSSSHEKAINVDETSDDEYLKLFEKLKNNQN